MRHVTDQRDCRSDTIVFDPFCGSGTTPLAAISEGFQAVAHEINPFLAFVAKSKISRVSPESFQSRFDEVIDSNPLSRSSLEEFSTFSENAPLAIRRKKWLFNLTVLRAFEGCWAATRYESKIDRLVQLCLLGAAMDVSNAKRDGKCLRYRDNWYQRGFGESEFKDSASNRANMILEDLEVSAALPGKAIIRLRDARRKSANQEFDLCITSPPYLNSFDYTDVYRPELFLSGFISNMSELRALRQTTIRSHLQTNWKAPKSFDFGDQYSKTITELMLRTEQFWDKRIPMMVQAYFEDMQKVFENLMRSAKPGAEVWMVVSTSAYAGVEIPVDLILADIGSTEGWFLREVCTLRHLRRLPEQQRESLRAAGNGSTPYLRESLIIFDREPRKSEF